MTRGGGSAASSRRLPGTVGHLLLAPQAPARAERLALRVRSRDRSLLRSRCTAL